MRPYLNGIFVRTIAACKSNNQSPQLNWKMIQKPAREEKNVNMLLMNRDHNCGGLTDNIYNLFHHEEK